MSTFEPNPLITRQVVLDYERVRKTDRANMASPQSVGLVALTIQAYTLASMLLKDLDDGNLFKPDSLFEQLRQHYSEYMKLYNISNE